MRKILKAYRQKEPITFKRARPKFSKKNRSQKTIK